MADVRGQLALVTGGTGGIGKATCLKLAEVGCDVAIHYHTARDDAEELARAIRKLNVRAEVFQADLSNYDEVRPPKCSDLSKIADCVQVRRLHKEVSTELGHPSILYNNAGTTLGKHQLTRIEQVTIEDFETTWRANCGSAFLLTQLCMPAMETIKWGRIIFCSSVAGFIGGVVGPHYS